MEKYVKFDYITEKNNKYKNLKRKLNRRSTEIALTSILYSLFNSKTYIGTCTDWEKTAKFILDLLNIKD
jgi:hypothetical protein